ncbi:FAD-binding oxidoreductase [Corallococcus macrosporus]|uniref:FAD-binding oxidoreductase n=1 Tax=Corallococcus macrosporus TaxID=35 RepID=A0ABS3DPT6_9BACT|nr:FAD-binding oxidoreductase [Corallococcus macrosporus]MBN8233337.1 FAD-binding oxidoreductase [Corallococcus macrosporus]
MSLASSTALSSQTLEALAGIVGPQWLRTGEEAGKRGTSTTSVSRRVPAVVFPASTREVVALVELANAQGLALYPVSTGRNWGYGCGAPVRDDCVVVDLSRMNRIVSLDAELGLVTVQPGVTQGMLSQYLREHRLPFLVPVTGAGPDCSLLGNALERGYGITPHADHFGAITRLEAVLPDGSLYRSAHGDLGGQRVDQAFKWGVGPYLDGLFSQSNLGIVTELTFVLARRPEHLEAFFFWVRDDAGLEDAVGAIRETLRDLGGVVGAINLLNPQRVLSMVAPYPRNRVPRGDVLSAELLSELSSQHGVAAWTGTGGLYGTREVVRAARSTIQKRLGRVARRLVFMGADRARMLSQWVPRLPMGLGAKLSPQVRTLSNVMSVLEGVPTQMALPLAYWKSGRRPPEGVPLNPNADGCGLLWTSPLVPMMPELVRTYVRTVREVTARHRLEPLITLTSLSDRCFDSSIPLLFDREDPDEAARALACQQELLDTCRREGFLPYRVGTHTMRWLAEQAPQAWRLTESLKRALDPRQVLAPDRYSGV